MADQMLTLGMANHRPRVVDAELKQRMTVMGAVLIDGPKAVGKTVSGTADCKRHARLDVRNSLG